MAIFRGVGGAGTASDNAFLLEISEASEAAQAAAEQAEQSALAAVNAEVSSATFNTSDGVLTLTKTGGATVTADLDGRFLTSYTETNDLSTAVTWADVPDANITESSVTQHLTAANVTSPLTGGTGISIASNGTITNDSPDQTVVLTGTGATTVTGTYPNFTIDSTDTTYTVGDGGLTTNDFTDADHSKLDGIEANADVTDTDNVTSAGALMDSEVTNLAQVKAFDSSDYATATQGTTADNALPKAGGQMTGNITFSGTQTVDGRDLSVDGTKLDGIDSGASAYYNYSSQLFTGYTNLGTSPAQIGSDFYLRNYSNNFYKRFIDVSATINYFTITSTNDLNIRVIVVVPSGSGNAVDIGSVESITTTAIYNRELVFDGDVTHWFSDYAGIATNSNGTNAFTNVISSVYNPTTGKTTAEVGVYGMTPPSVGDSIYVHPFDWEGAGSELYGVTQQFDVKAGSSSVYQVFSRTYLGNIDRIATCRIKLYESFSSDSLNIQRLRVNQTDERT